MKGYADSPRPLTPRMRDVVRCGAAGHTITQTALELGIAEQTVMSIRAALCVRLEAPNFTAAVACSVRRGDV